MQRRQLLLGVTSFVGLTAFGAVAQAAQTEQDPFKWLLDVSNGILNTIRSSDVLRRGDMQALQKLVDERIMPTVDFTMMTRMTVGPQWRKATPEQRKALEQGFEQLLIQVYAGALDNVGNHVCELVPTRSRRIAKQMVIRTQLVSGNQPPIKMDYRIYQNRQGEWKVVDVNVEGIWMVENYREQFASVLNRDGIDGLIHELQNKEGKLSQKPQTK